MIRDRFVNALHSIKAKSDAPAKRYIDMKPHLIKAVRAATPYAVQIVMNKLRTANLNNNHGRLKDALRRVYLDLKWVNNKPKLSLTLPSNLGEDMYRVVMSLDHGRKTSSGKTKAYKIFTLSKSERTSLGAYVEQLAMSYSAQER